MSKLTKLTKAVPAKNAVPAKKAVPAKNAENSRYFTTPTYGDWDDDEGSYGIDELLAEFYIQSRDCSGAGVVDPINVAKLLNMVGLRAVVVSGVNNEDYEIRHCFTGADVCGNILLSAITSKFIARNSKNLINQLLDIELKYNGNKEDSVKNTRTLHLFPSVVDIARHSARLGGALGAIRTWAAAGIRIDSTNFSIAEDSAIQQYMSDQRLTLDDYIKLVTIGERFTGSIDGTIFGPFSQITSGLPLEDVIGIGGDQCDGGKTLTEVMNERSLEEYYEDEKPEGSSDYWGRLTVACYFFENSDVLDWIVASVRVFTDANLFQVLEDFNTLSEGYLYSELTLDERVEVLSAKSISILVHILNDEETVEELVTSIIAHKTAGLTTLPSVNSLPTTPRVPPASEYVRKFFGVLSQVVGILTHTDRMLSYNDLAGSHYYNLFYFTRTSGNITISSKVTGNIYTPANFTESGNKLSDANIALLLDALGLTDSDELDITIGHFLDSGNDTEAQRKLIKLFNGNFGANAIFRHLVVTANATNWNHGRTVLDLYLQIIGSETNTADTMMRHIYDVMEVIKTVRGVKASIQASCHTLAITPNSDSTLLKGLLRLLDHGAEPSEIYELLGTSESDKHANVRGMASAVSTVPSGEHRVDWRKVNELIQLAGIQTFSTNNGVMTTSPTATMLQNWALAFADTDADTYAQLHEAGFEAWELLTYTRTTNVYTVVDGRAVKGADETTMAFNLDWVCDAYGTTLEQLAKEAYDNYGITLDASEGN